MSVLALGSTQGFSHHDVENRNLLNFELRNCTDVDRAQKLIIEGADVNEKDSNGNTPLHAAVERNDAGMIEFLNRNGANVDVKNNKSMSSLHLASQKGYLNSLASLLESGANPNLTNEENETPFHISALKGDLDCCNLLLLKGADPFINLKKIDINDFLFRSFLKAKDPNVIKQSFKFILNKVKNPSELNDFSPISFACSMGNEYVQILSDYIAGADEEGVTHFLSSLECYENKQHESFIQSLKEAVLKRLE